jgi:surfactin synthase thioesterase subunit
MPPWLELIRVQLPGREDNASPPVRRMDDLIPQLMDDVLPLLDKPLAVYGHCLGSLIGFELARALRRRCERDMLVGLFVSGRRAPQKKGGVVLHDLPEPALLRELEAMGALSPLLTNERWRRYYLETIRADMSITDTYMYRDEPALDCPLHLFVGEDDPRREVEGWPEQTNCDYRSFMLSGGHFFSKEGTAQLTNLIQSYVGGQVSEGPPLLQLDLAGDGPS